MAEAVTNNWADAVLMIAASTADQMRPATNGVKRRSVMIRNTVSASVPTNLSGNIYT